VVGEKFGDFSATGMIEIVRKGTRWGGCPKSGGDKKGWEQRRQTIVWNGGMPTTHFAHARGSDKALRHKEGECWWEERAPSVTLWTE